MIRRSPWSRSRRRRGLATTTVALLGLSLVGCDRGEEVRVYEVSKSAATTRAARADLGEAGLPPARMPSMGGTSTTMMAQGPSPTVGWTVPAGWQQVADARPMRVATFRAGESASSIEVVVSQFPGDVGGILANVNRWRQQVNLPAIQEAQLAKELTPFATPTMRGHSMWLKGPTQHMLAAILFEPEADRTWFVKATVSPQQAERHRAEVEAFARSFGTSHASGAPATTRPSDAGQQQ